MDTRRRSRSPRRRSLSPRTRDRFQAAPSQTSNANTGIRGGGARAVQPGIPIQLPLRRGSANQDQQPQRSHPTSTESKPTSAKSKKKKSKKGKANANKQA
jgi:hypothetical protein